MLELLFVYGTLRSEFDNPYARLLREEALPIGPAMARGSLYRLENYPGFRPEPASAVRGELYRLMRAEETLQALDEYEGPEFERIVIEIETREAGVQQAWIYTLKHAAPEEARIVSGDFCAS
jgi:gamma-glutamylcyclotransferase (GGCT)/AIG2-like uncharacterized protein YtfP